MGAVESVKAASDIYAPVDGKVIEINQELEKEPSLINSSPYDKGWIAKLHVNDLSSMESSLMNEQEYQKHIGEL
jgi:glycine cleavage system H protein